MFRGYLPALTLLVFGIGTGIGLSWSRGWIPLSLTPAKTGSIGPEFLDGEPLPPPPDSLLPRSANLTSTVAFNPTSEETELLQNQSEPDLRDANNVATIASDEQNRRLPDLASHQEDYSSSDENNEKSTSENPQPIVRLRKRGQKAIQVNSAAEQDDDSQSPKKRKVVSVAHQDSGESDNEGRESSRDADDGKPSARELLAMAEEKLASGETLKAHRDLSTIYWNHKDYRPQIQEMIDNTAKTIFFQSKPHFVEPYVIQEGDRLESIAKKYQLSWEYLAKLNRTNPKRIQVGQKLKVIKGPFGAIVDLKDFVLIVHLQGYYVKRYDVGIGKDGSSPIGEFPVRNKVENPEYTDDRTGKTIKGDDPSNPLGERWIDLGDSYGIHGTIDPNSIGKSASRGCIRMRDSDIVEVYDFLVKGSKVVLRQEK